MSGFRRWCANNGFTIAGILGVFFLLIGAGLILRPRLMGVILRYGLAGLSIYVGMKLLTRSFRCAGGR